MKKYGFGGLLVLIVVVVVGMFMLNEVAQDSIKNIGKSATEKSNSKK